MGGSNVRVYFVAFFTHSYAGYRGLIKSNAVFNVVFFYAQSKFFVCGYVYVVGIGIVQVVIGCQGKFTYFVVIKIIELQPLCAVHNRTIDVGVQVSFHSGNEVGMLGCGGSGINGSCDDTLSPVTIPNAPFYRKPAGNTQRIVGVSK